MSKRLKLVTGSESEMEERSFNNPFSDWDQGVLVSSNSEEDSNSNDPFDANGKVCVRFICSFSCLHELSLQTYCCPVTRKHDNVLSCHIFVIFIIQFCQVSKYI